MTRYLEIKPGSITEVAIRLRDDYQAFFKKELEKAGKGIAQMTDAEKKSFFNRVDKEYNAKNEETPAKKLDDTNSTMVVKPGAPKGQESVIRIPKEKLADYKKKGYIEAESYIPEAKKIDELTAGQKKLPPALQKAIKAKEKSEAVDNPYAVGMAAAMKATGDKPPLKKSTIVKAHDIAKKIEKNEEIELDEVTESFYDSDEYKNYLGQITSLSNDKVMARVNKKGDAAIAAIQSKIDAIKDKIKIKKAAEKKEEIKLEAVDLKLLKPGNYITVKSKQYVIDKINGDVIKTSDINGDFKYFKMKDIEKVQSSYSLATEFKPEDGVNLSEGQYKEIDTRKGDLRIAKDKRQALKDKYNAIMANQATGDEDSIADQIQKLDMSIKKQEQELIDIMKKSKETKNEEVDPMRITNLQQKIQKMNTKVGELDKADPESKTKEAILKSDIATAKLRLQDLMAKKSIETKKAINELKKTYKTLKMSMKKEQDMDKKKTMTDKPLTKVDVDPKLPTH